MKRAEVLPMPFTLLAICILGCDVLLYVLFCWAYPDRSDRRDRPQAASRRASLNAHPDSRFARHDGSRCSQVFLD
jgi:hypothetical protein